MYPEPKLKDQNSNQDNRIANLIHAPNMHARETSRVPEWIASREHAPGIYWYEHEVGTEGEEEDDVGFDNGHFVWFAVVADGEDDEGEEGGGYEEGVCDSEVFGFVGGDPGGEDGAVPLEVVAYADSWGKWLVEGSE